MSEQGSQSARPAIAAGKRLFVAPFTGAAPDPGKLQSALLVQIRHLPGVHLVTDRSQADVVLNGRGDVWVKGYVSLNPRASKSNATAIYAGFLSIELKDARGETLWSYLASAPAESQDIAKDLARRVIKPLAGALQQ